LKKLLWSPLQEPLAGVQTVLISPDGVLNQIPLAALPGQNARTYLLEEIELAVVPVPRLLPLLLGAPKKSLGTDYTSAAEQSLLIVGDVSYGGSPGKAEGILVAGARSAVRGDRAGRMQFAELESTRPEMATIRDSFERDFSDGRVRALRGGRATESAFRSEAPKYRWLHLATHGFFAPPEIASALAPLTLKKPGWGMAHQHLCRMELPTRAGILGCGLDASRSGLAAETLGPPRRNGEEALMRLKAGDQRFLEGKTRHAPCEKRSSDFNSSSDERMA
jgi:hypothetical protein